jgi:hypothetical protein
MQEHNNLIAQQVDIFRNTSILKEQNDKAIYRLQEIEEKKLKLSIMPNLWLNGTSFKGRSGEFTIDLNNKGEEAKLIDFKLISNDIQLHSQSLPYDLSKGERRYIFGRIISGKHFDSSNIEIDIIYQDKLKNKYMSKIKGVGYNVKIVANSEI